MAMIGIYASAKRNGTSEFCLVTYGPDGCSWYCPYCEPFCGQMVVRVRLGVLDGTPHCTCGAEIELVVDEQIVDIAGVSALPCVPGMLQRLTSPAIEHHHQIMRAQEEAWLELRPH